MAKKNKKTKKSDVPRALERAGALCLAFANTGVSRRDDRRRKSKAPPSMPLETYGELLTWAQRMGALAGDAAERLRSAAAHRPEEAEAVRARAVRLRSAIVRVFTGWVLGEEPRTEDMAAINRELVARRAVPAGDGFAWDWSGNDGALDRPLWPLAQSAAELLISDDLANVDQCAAKGCFQLFVRRNPRRRWCDMSACGNRLKSARYQRYMKSIETSVERRAAERRETARRARPAAAEANAGDADTSSTSREANAGSDAPHLTVERRSSRLVASGLN